MENNRFHKWDVETVVSQLKAQAKDQLDPELEMFYLAVVDRLTELQDDVTRLHNEKMDAILEKYKIQARQ